jgi:hypothetical protein
LNYFPFRLPEYRQLSRLKLLMSLKTHQLLNGTPIAYSSVPVIVAAAGEIFGKPNKSRRPARATAHEAALKREEPAGKVCGRNGELSIVHIALVRPVTCAVKRNAPLPGGAFRAPGETLKTKARR